jgi:hypothetical protein
MVRVVIYGSDVETCQRVHEGLLGEYCVHSGQFSQQYLVPACELTVIDCHIYIVTNAWIQCLNNRVTCIRNDLG